MTLIDTSISQTSRSQLPKLSTPPVLASSDFAALLDQEKSPRALRSFGELGLFTRPYIPPATPSMPSPIPSNNFKTLTGSPSQAPLRRGLGKSVGHVADGSMVMTVRADKNFDGGATSFLVDHKLSTGFASALAVQRTPQGITPVARPQSAEITSANQSAASDTATEGISAPVLPRGLIVEMRDRSASRQTVSRLTVSVEGGNCAIVIGGLDTEHDQTLNLRDMFEGIVTQNGLTMGELTINGTVVPLHSNR
jgi:hypothetical protein